MITVTGSASRELAPDGVSWRADAVEVDREARAAFERCGARLNALTETLAAVGDVTTEAVSVRPELSEARGEPTGRIQAIGGVRVRAEPSRAAELAQAAMAAGADRLHGPHFLYDSAEAVREELLADALTNARRKADRLAEAAGRRVAGVQTIAEEDHYHGVVELAGVSEGPDIRGRSATITATLKVTFSLEG